MVQGQHALVLNGNGNSLLRQFDLTTAMRVNSDNTLYVSYVRSHAASDLNEFNNYLANFPPAVTLPNYYATLPGDVPNRFLAWGVIHFPWKFQLMPKVEYRTGFPYSSTNALQNYVGTPNQARFPRFLSVDARVSKDFRVSDKYTLQFSVAGSNLTDHFNPISVHSNIDDRQHGVFFGQYRRRFTADFDVIF